MDILEEATTYFKSNKGYLRLFKGIKNNYISFGEMKGNVVIINPTLEEKRALSGLMKKDYSKNKTISININKLEKQLQETKFSGINLKDILMLYFQEDILTKQENKKRYQEELDIFFQNILKQNEKEDVYPYLKEIIKNKNHIYYHLKKYYNKEKNIFQKALEDACKGINHLPKQKIRIPVFASNTINNPHGYDKKNLCGKIFIMLLSFINNIPIPKNSEELSELYYQNNLLVDDISNMVLCRNILGYEKIDGLEHKGLKGFEEYHEPIYLTIYNLSNISKLKENKHYQKVLITENPAVFMEIVEKCRRKDFPLVCTYGQVKLAGIILLDLLVEAGFQLYYSGDIDPEGIQIADKLKQRYQENLHFIGFDIDTYFNNMSNISLSETRIHKLKQIKSNELKEICEEVNKRKQVAYEEQNIPSLIKWIENNTYSSINISSSNKK